MASLFATYRAGKRSACARLQAGSQLFQTSAGEIEAALTGHGRAVLISHGSGGGYDMGLWLAGLIGGEFRYIAPSRFGYLRSPLPSNPSPEAQADAYAVLLDVLNVRSVVIIGLSGGGPSTLQFALRHAGHCRGLIMLSAASRPVPPLPPLVRAIYPFMLGSDFIPWALYAAAPYAVFQMNGVDRALLARIKDDPEKMRLLDTLYWTTFPSTLRRDGMLNDMQHMTSFPLYPLEQITVPALVVHAVNDPIMPFGMGEYSARSIPDARFLKMETGGHFTSVTHREEILPVVLDFLDRHAA
jgi:pimeloyl-ACP methyl ester carboxylesterase